MSTPTPTPVRSPCIDICSINEQTGFCKGCYRSLQEIACWSTYSDDDKRAVLEKLALRKPL